MFKKIDFPQSWSTLTWEQICMCWQAKIRYGGNPDVARCAALLCLMDCSVEGRRKNLYNSTTGEMLYNLRDKDGHKWIVTPRELSQMAKAIIPWFDYPYGDPGEPEERDDKGVIVKRRREPVGGYVGPMRDALQLTVDKLKIGYKTFALPQVACNNLTWQQYRSLQVLSPLLFQENGEENVLEVQSKFLAHILTPRSMALFATAGGSIRFRPHYEFHYDTEQADGLIPYWRKRLSSGSSGSLYSNEYCQRQALFHICFQVYQTALAYYSVTYPLLFTSTGKKDPLRDALTGEVGTINTVMKYAGYADQQQVYDSNLPFVLDILNTMAKEAKEVEKMNRKAKKK